MKQSRMRTLGEVTALVSVVLSLLFLAFEVNQGNDVARMTASETRIREFSEWYVTIATDPVLSELYARMQEPEPVYSPVERLQISFMAMVLWNNLLAVHEAHENGLIDQATHDIYKRAVPVFMTLYPAHVPVWKGMLGYYPEIAEYPIFADVIADTDETTATAPEE